MIRAGTTRAGPCFTGCPAAFSVQVYAALCQALEITRELCAPVISLDSRATAAEYVAPMRIQFSVRRVAAPRGGGMKDMTALGWLEGLGWSRAELVRMPSGDGAIQALVGPGVDALAVYNQRAMNAVPDLMVRRGYITGRPTSYLDFFALDEMADVHRAAAEG